MEREEDPFHWCNKGKARGREVPAAWRWKPAGCYHMGYNVEVGVGPNQRTSCEKIDAVRE